MVLGLEMQGKYVMLPLRKLSCSREVPMQVSVTNTSKGTSSRIPALILKRIDEDRLATRLSQIGDRQRFGIILSRLRMDFPLAICQELEGLPWWIVAATQHEEIVAFCKRNGLQLVEVL